MYLRNAASPPMYNKSWTISADIELADDKSNGMIVTHGGLEGGYGLYLRDGRPTFTAKDPLPKGKIKLVVDFVYDGGGMGKGGTITMTANGNTTAQGRLERTIPISLSLTEGLDVGMDVGSPIDFTYTMQFAFTGKIEKVEIDLKPEASSGSTRGEVTTKAVQPVGS